MDCPDTEGNCGLTIPHTNGAVVVWVSDLPEHVSGMVNTIIHESVHVFQAMMEYILESAPGKEIQAYTIAQIAETLLLSYQEQVKELTSAVHEKGQER